MEPLVVVLSATEQLSINNTTMHIANPSGSNGTTASVTLCAWTKRVYFAEQWLSIEEYLKRAHGLMVTYGLSPDAVAELSTLRPVQARTNRPAVSQPEFPPEEHTRGR
jgi:hypothetical protein